MSRFSGCSRALTPSRNSEAPIEVEPDNASTPVSLIVPPGHTWSRATNSPIVMNGAVDRLAKRRQCTGTTRCVVRARSRALHSALSRMFSDKPMRGADRNAERSGSSERTPAALASPERVASTKRQARWPRVPYVWQQEVRDAAIHARAKASAADVAARRSDPARRHHQPRDADATPDIRVVVERIRLHVRPPESLSGSRAHETPCRIESRTGVVDVFKREGLMAGMGSRARKPAASNQDRASLDERRVPRRPPTVLETSNGAPSSPT